MPIFRSLQTDLARRCIAVALLLFAEFLLASRANAQITREHPVSEVTYGPAPGSKLLLSAVFDGENYFAVWQDWRSYSGSTLYAAHVSERGVLLDQPTGIRLPFVANDVDLVVVDDGYALLWAEGTDLVAALLNRDGSVALPPHRVCSNIPSPFFSVASNGSTIVVVFRDRAFVVNARTELVERDVILPVRFAGNPGQIASNGTGFLVVWSEENLGENVKAIALDSHGHPIGDFVVIEAIGDIASIASNGTDFLVLYRGAGRHVVRRVSSDARTISAAVPLEEFRAQSLTSVVPTGNSYLVTTVFSVSVTDQVTVQAIRIDADGQRISGQPAEILRVDPWANLTVVSGRNTIAVFTLASDIAIHTIDAQTLKPVGECLLSQSSVAQASPSLAFSGRNYLAAWVEGTDLLAGRVSLAGDPLDRAGIKIATVTLGEAIASPKVIFDGAHYILAWLRYDSAGGAVRACRIDVDTGAVLDEGGVTLDAPAGGPTGLDLASDGQSFVAVWAEYRGMIRAARFNRFLQVLDLRSLSPSGLAAGNPSVAWNGREWLVVFEEQFWSTFFPQAVKARSNVLAVRLSPLMTVLDTEPIVVAASEPLESDDVPHVASDGADFLVSWTHANGSVAHAVLGRYYRADAFTGGAFTLVSEGSVRDLVWEGLRYAIAYTAGPGYRSYDLLLSHAGRTGEGSLHDHLSIATGVAGQATENSVVELTPTNAGTVVTVYTRLATETMYGGVPRVFVREPAAISRGRAVRHR